MVKTYAIGPIRLLINSATPIPLWYFAIGKWSAFISPTRPFRVAYEYARRLFPYFYAVGLRSCDEPHYGRVWAWAPVWALNYWHMNRITREWDNASDGPACFDEIGLFSFLKLRRKLKAENRSYHTVER